MGVVMSWNKAGFDRGKSLDIEYGTGTPIRVLYSNDHEKRRWMSTYTKEPDTLWWITQFEKNKIFYDIGANIGLFSFVAAKQGSYGLSLDEITKSLPAPNYIKIDVDGIERLVIDGYSHWDKLDSFLVEVNSNVDRLYIIDKIVPFGFKHISVSDNIIFYKEGFDTSFLGKKYARATAGRHMYNMINKDGLVAK